MKPSGTRFLLLLAVLSLSLAGLPRCLAGEEMPERMARQVLGFDEPAAVAGDE